MVIRRGGRQDVRFLRDMLHHAYYWREREPGEGPGPVALYVKGWGRSGDTALIAVDDGFPVGAAWYRLFRRDQPGYGFVDEETPELAIAVVPSRRGRGLGEALFSALCDRARAATTSGFAYTLGRMDGNVTLDEVVEHVATLDRATELPISVDLENGYGPE